MNSHDITNCIIKRKAKTNNCYTMTFKGLTREMILSINCALLRHSEHSEHYKHSEHSSVVAYTRDCLENGIEHSNDLELIRKTHLTKDKCHD